MNDYALLVDLHLRQTRQGPGGDRETQMAIDLARLDESAPLKIADIGCGTGASTRVLAQSLPNAHVTAVDLMPEFIEVLATHAEQNGWRSRIQPRVASMDDLPFETQEFDVIWSEGAIYNLGFERGITDWRRFLKPDGVLVVSEITWTTGDRPSELQNYWETEYPEIATAASKLQILDAAGYAPMAYFTLPKHCWLDNYYRPLERSFEAFLERHPHNEAARQIVASERDEMATYERYRADYSYGMYVARNNGSAGA